MTGPGALPVVAAGVIGIGASMAVWTSLGRSGTGNTDDLLDVHGMSASAMKSVVGFVAAALLVGGWLLGSPSLATVGPLVVVIGAAEHSRRRRQSAQVATDEQLPLFVESMVQRLRSGMGLHGVCLDPPSVGPSVDRMAAPMTAALGQGEALVEAVSRFGGQSTGSHDATGRDAMLVATALKVIATHGGPAAPALQRLRLTLSGLAHSRADTRARAAQGLASARLLILAPVLFAVLLASFDDELGHLYTREWLGALCVSGCAILSYSGWWWMNRLASGVGSMPQAEPMPQADPMRQAEPP